MLFFISCNNTNNDHNSKQGETSYKIDNNLSSQSADLPDDEKRMQSYIPAKIFEIEPLTYDQYMSIRNNQDAFSMLVIEIEKETHDPFIRYWSAFSCKQLAGANHFSVCDVFKGTLNSTLRPYIPDNSDCYYEVEFTGVEMEQILSHLEEHHDYYFNNEEFDGLEVPFVVARNCIDAKNYNFRLYVHEPNPSMEENFRINLINKFVDELIPGTPLYELFQIWEVHFLSKLLQNEIECL